MSRHIILTILNIANPIAIFFIYEAIFKKRKYNARVTFLAYLGFFIITTLVLIFSQSSYLNSLANVMGFIGLTFLYKDNISFKIFYSYYNICFVWSFGDFFILFI